jgi:hypothetical protein
MTSVFEHDGVYLFDFGDGNSIGQGILDVTGKEHLDGLSNLRSALIHLDTSQEDNLVGSRQRLNDMLYDAAHMPATKFPASVGKTVMQLAAAEDAELLDFVKWSDADHTSLENGLASVTEELQEETQMVGNVLKQVGYLTPGKHAAFSRIVAETTEFGVLDAVDAAGSDMTGLCNGQGEILMSNLFQESSTYRGVSEALRYTVAHEVLHAYGVVEEKGFAFTAKSPSLLLEEVTVTHMASVGLGLAEPGVLRADTKNPMIGYEPHTRFIQLLLTATKGSPHIFDLVRAFVSGKLRDHRKVTSGLDAGVRQLLPEESAGWEELNARYQQFNSLVEGEQFVTDYFKKAHRTINRDKVREAIAQDIR